MVCVCFCLEAAGDLILSCYGAMFYSESGDLPTWGIKWPECFGKPCVICSFPSFIFNALWRALVFHHKLHFGSEVNRWILTVSEHLTTSVSLCHISSLTEYSKPSHSCFFLVFFLRVASKINARHYGDLCSTEMGGNTSMKLTAFLPQSQIMVLCYEFVAVGGSDSSGFYCCSCFFYIKRDLFSILNV